MPENQVTFRQQNHQLTNAQVWSADSQCLAYDLRPSSTSFTSQTIEKINVFTGEVTELYRAHRGAHVGVVTAHPKDSQRFVCIHGPEDPDTAWHYDLHHRRGVIIQQGVATTLDACDITQPYTLGALRGGSHVHMYSYEGDRLSFTYNDHVMHERSQAEDQRNVGIALPDQRVEISPDHPREHSGSHFCVLISQTTINPIPGSDQILRAFEEGWIGHRGYRRSDGEWQRWAIAFIGETIALDGSKRSEIFIVDLPEAFDDYTRMGVHPIEGTAQQLPAPPAGIQQRRITFSHGDGVALQPRHWLRSSPSGEFIAFLMADDAGIIQLWTISPNGGVPRQLTKCSTSIQSAFTWHPEGKALCFICDNSVMVYCLASANLRRLTARTTLAPCAEAVVWSPNGSKIAYMREIEGYRQIFYVEATE